jgi:23S rRNA (cytosine1962-C5)-methyltransferase
MNEISHKVFLKRGKERIIELNRHPWIFSGAIDTFSKGFSSGDIASVYSHEGNFLALAYFHLDNSLSGRILSFEQKPIQEILTGKIRSALSFRKKMFNLEKTNAFRCINAEEDGLPGLIVDLYDDVVVLQINTLGMEKLRPILLPILVKEFTPRSIYEKSLSSSRALEGLLPVEGLLYGEEVSEVTIVEEGILFKVSIVNGQKTGFFLDQREMRRKIGELARGKSVLNCFSYSGGFSLHALKGGAKSVTSVDVCHRALELSLQNTRMNGFCEENHVIKERDVFAFLEEEELSSYDIIILDPPAFAKKRQDIEAASRGYHRLARKAIERCKKDAIVLLCSCSYFMDAALFRQIIFKAASESRKDVKIISSQIQALCHPISLFHPEGEYLKSFLLWVS